MIIQSGQLRAVLSIAGSDPSGGAGIQADLKTFSTIGVYGAAAITSLTVQNTCGVIRNQPVDADLVRQQVQAVLDDLNVSHVKIGMVGNRDIAMAIDECLKGFSGEVVCDPVLAATTGQPLIEDNDLEALSEYVFEHATVLIPNMPELETLAGCQCDDIDHIKEAAAVLFKRFPKLRVMIAKGGHLDIDLPEATDYLLLYNRESGAVTVQPESHPRIDTTNTHGTGCSFASAFTAYHQQTGDDRLAFRKTTGFMDQLLTVSSAYSIGQGGHGPLLHHLILSS
jgi:hydroxymethylpyrimidine/phosphomethylpyrimidine kinase